MSILNTKIHYANENISTDFIVNGVTFKLCVSYASKRIDLRQMNKKKQHKMHRGLKPKKVYIPL